ncbi:hypothetical protein GCM10009760_23160 [Kitasatospora kazusensis]|uniref:Integral membrane protein n=1 Tax=Kitasatospora kazusensis TaxID=407974 RepID=A0ABN2ZCK9_9ACTN
MADGGAGGEWWRVDGPWRVFGRSDDGAAAAATAAAEDGGASVYAPEVPVEPAVQLTKEPAAPVTETFWPPTRALGAQDFPGWDSVQFDFSTADPRPEPATAPVPEQRAVEPAAAEPAAEGGTSLLAGRRPSVIVLAAAVVLLGGAATGQVLALLAGWALAYVAPRLGDLTRKFAALGIPLVTMAGSTVWFWGRAKGRWGAPVTPGHQIGHDAWAAAPGVLRVAGLLSALFLLAVTLRRRSR